MRCRRRAWRRQRSKAEQAKGVVSGMDFCRGGGYKRGYEISVFCPVVESIDEASGDESVSGGAFAGLGRRFFEGCPGGARQDESARAHDEGRPCAGGVFAGGMHRMSDVHQGVPGARHRVGGGTEENSLVPRGMYCVRSVRGGVSEGVLGDGSGFFAGGYGSVFVGVGVGIGGESGSEDGDAAVWMAAGLDGGFARRGDAVVRGGMGNDG